MTIEAVRRKSNRAAGREERDELPIGEVDANIFNCPACARPLGVGTTRCPGCRTRLLAGIRATRAVGFMAIGLVAGSLLGGGIMTLALTLTRPVPVAAVETVPIVAPSIRPVASAQAPVVDPAVPTSALSALRQSALVNQRLVREAGKLTSALAGEAPSAVDIARALRALAANAAFGDRIAPGVADWSSGTGLSADLVTFYATVGGTAREGLSSSITNTGAYIAAAKAMLATMGSLADLDQSARALAGTAGLELPSLEPATTTP